MPSRLSSLLTFTLLAIVSGTSQSQLHAQDNVPKPDKWESQMQKFEQQDRAQPPQPGGVVFVGSSSIRLWDLEKWFPGMNAVNRGFGGSETSDCIRHFDRLITPHQPRLIVFFAGTNDLSHGETPTSVHQDFLTFCDMVHE